MYKILPPKSRILLKSIRDLPPAHKKDLPEAFNDIENRPYSHPTPGKISPFTGDLKHLGWHYKLSDKYRIHYRVNEKTKEITITYIGPHPKY